MIRKTLYYKYVAEMREFKQSYNLVCCDKLSALEKTRLEESTLRQRLSRSRSAIVR